MYVDEKNDFPGIVAEVATAVPVFIGYTQKAEHEGKSLLNRPHRIDGPDEYRKYFGGAPTPKFEIRRKEAGSSQEAVFSLQGQGYCLHRQSGRYFLDYSMRLFFANGGGPCYVVSVGSYQESITLERLAGGLEPLRQEREPTLVAVPDAMLLESGAECAALQRAILEHCGRHARNRFAILDIYEGPEGGDDPDRKAIRAFRDAIGTACLGHAAAYYPWLKTTVVGSQDVGPENIGNADLLQALIEEELGIPRARIDENVMRQSKVFRLSMEDIRKRLNLLPPSGAMAGIYALVDRTKGVWKAPANVQVNAVNAPAVMVSDSEQENMNVSPDGKSVNAIQSFPGEGVLVWGARTLDSNSADWRYINVRRTASMLEESMRLACGSYAFEPHTADTWGMIRSALSNFLLGIWQRGGLAGAVPDDAFSVRIGLGQTMTPEDVQAGTLRVSVLVALARPGKFIEIAFQQQMQKS
ncbi:phage tail sheath family protein [Pseudothauera rhizosphaerae]|uniref:phage tail sheath family protein n=1 Tax=Pseudothauera rhizosphaerae TaxID=2565932 RepID=UPI001B3B2328|nr:phage tail sheath C-terminal domain-containing protein [Pseudothauera rhizosphaerae]